MNLLLRWLLNALALILVSYLVPGFVVANFYSALIAALILGLVNASIRPILLILTFPITILTLGLFAIVINAAMVSFVATIVKGFEVDSFGTAFIAAIILSLVSWGSSALLQSTSSKDTQ